MAAGPRTAYVAGMTRVLILGAGHAGGAAAAALRQFGHDGPILLVGEEPQLPYQRPPLSKAWLKGEARPEDLFLRPESFYAEQGIEVRLGARAEAIDAAGRTVTFADGTTEPYDVLILATGSVSRALPLPGADLPGVLALRSMAEAEALKARLTPGARLVVIGGGFVGLEAAASARALGCEAVVLERAPRLLSRVASEPVSTLLAARHRAGGVAVHTDIEIVAIAADGDRLRVVHAGGTEAGEVVLVGVGADACDALARSAGLACDGGVVVDDQARTSDPAIFAIGDVTLRPMPIYGRDFRMESVPNALEQAKQVACAITGRPAPAGETPWQWSDQYDIKLQIAGYNFDSDQSLVRGDPASGHFAIFHLKGDQVQAVEAINSPPEFMMGRQLIGSRRPVDKQRLADTSVSMKEVAAA